MLDTYFLPLAKLYHHTFHTMFPSTNHKGKRKVEANLTVFQNQALLSPGSHLILKCSIQISISYQNFSPSMKDIGWSVSDVIQTGNPESFHLAYPKRTLCRHQTYHKEIKMSSNFFNFYSNPIILNLKIISKTFSQSQKNHDVLCSCNNSLQ